jgi:hypothetical protein
MVITMSCYELTRLRVLIDVTDGERAEARSQSAPRRRGQVNHMHCLSVPILCERPRRREGLALRAPASGGLRA